MSSSKPSHEHSPLDPLAAHASDLSAPSTVAKAEASEHAEIWRDSRVGEFSRLL